ncbi:MAG: hypothetical protein JWR63_1885 [Conexibacter sp.]|nr:hypothetical protein [Conexibacter sp.]
MLGSLRRRRVIALLAVVSALVLAVSAYAYFTSTGSGTGSATVGSSTAFTVNVAASTGGPLFPGAGTVSFNYTVTNPSTGHQNLSATTATVASSGGNITEGSPAVAVAGCLSSWFTAVNTAPTPLPQNLAGGATSSGGSVAVTMQDSGTSQDPCQGHTPNVTVNAS